jgi:hypothetical protein
MSKSALRTIRDIVVIIAAIGIAVTLYVRLKAPDTNLKHDIQVNPDSSSGHGMMDMHMGGGAELFTDGDDSVVATAGDTQVTQKELYAEANKAFRRQGINPDDDKAKTEDFQYDVKTKALGVIFSNAIMLNKIKEAGLDVDAAVEKKLQDWAKDYSSPEEKLKSINGPEGITVDSMRRLFRNDVVPELTIQALTGQEGDVNNKVQAKILDDWLVNSLLVLEPKFEDTKLADYWSKYIENLKNTPPPSDQSTDIGMPHGMAHGGMPGQEPTKEG